MRTFLRKALKDKTHNTYVQFGRSVFVGGAAFLVDFIILWTLTDHMGIHYLISALFGFTLGLATAYVLSIYWVFKDRLLNKPWLEFIIFCGIGVVGIILNEFLLWFFSDVMLLHYLMSKIVATIVVFPFNFFARKHFLFK